MINDGKGNLYVSPAGDAAGRPAAAKISLRYLLLQEAKFRYKRTMENRTEPKTVGQWIRYVVVAIIAIWLVIWMLRLSGINIL